MSIHDPYKHSIKDTQRLIYTKWKPQRGESLAARHRREMYIFTAFRTDQSRTSAALNFEAATLSYFKQGCFHTASCFFHSHSIFVSHLFFYKWVYRIEAASKVSRAEIKKCILDHIPGHTVCPFMQRKLDSKMSLCFYIKFTTCLFSNAANVSGPISWLSPEMPKPPWYIYPDMWPFLQEFLHLIL